MRNEVIVTRDIANNKNNTPPENMDAFMLHTSSSVFSFITERRYLKCNRFHISCLFFFFLTIHFLITLLLMVCLYTLYTRHTIDQATNLRKKAIYLYLKPHKISSNCPFFKYLIQNDYNLIFFSYFCSLHFSEIT